MKWHIKWKVPSNKLVTYIQSITLILLKYIVYKSLPCDKKQLIIT